MGMPWCAWCAAAALWACAAKPGCSVAEPIAWWPSTAAHGDAAKPPPGWWSIVPQIKCGLAPPDNEFGFANGFLLCLPLPTLSNVSNVSNAKCPHTDLLVYRLSKHMHQSVINFIYKTMAMGTGNCYNTKSSLWTLAGCSPYSQFNHLFTSKL